MKRKFAVLIKEVKACELCAEYFAHQPRPVFQLNPQATILIAGQAPGRKVHESGIPFDDPSGERLRNWMGISKSIFYDETKIAILPMGFCYPGQGSSGDLPPRQECAAKWREPILDAMPNIKLTLLIGKYAIDWHLKQKGNIRLTDVVIDWKKYAPSTFPLPHPSPRNNIWLRKNPWFEDQVVPALKLRVRRCV